MDGLGNLYIADTYNHRIRKVDAAGTITTIAGSGEQGFSGDGGPASQAQLSAPFDVAADGSGNVYIADNTNHRIRKVDAAGTITTFAGTGEKGFSPDEGPAVEASLGYPRGVAVDGPGNVYIAAGSRIRKVDSTGTITTIAGRGGFFGGDGGPAVEAQFHYPSGMAVDVAGNLYIADTGNHRIRKVDATGTITTIAGRTFSGDGGPASQAQLSEPEGVAADRAGNVYISDSNNHRIRKVDATGTITTIAGTGESGFSGDGGPASQAQLFYPRGVAVDGLGNLYIVDSFNNRIRKADATGTITTIAGTGERGFGGDGGPASQAQLSEPEGVAVDEAGNLYIADSFNYRIRKVDLTGTITTIAGTGERGFGGDGGPASQAQLSSPGGVAVDGLGNLYIVDSFNNRIRKVDATGTITTIAGSGERGFAGDSGPAVEAALDLPVDAAVDRAGYVYIADWLNHVIRKLAPVGGSGTSPVEPESFSIPNLGGWSITSNGMETDTQGGYGRIRADAGSTTPSGLAIFQFRDSEGVLISEASVPATELIQEGRIFAEVEGPVNTGLALANPNDVPATIRFYFTDTTGTNWGSGKFELGEHEQTAKFLNQEPFNEALPDGSPVLGTFTFESSVPIAVIALRGFTNEADEFLMTTLPVAPLASTLTDTVYFPHFADGSGWATQVILVNPTDDTIAGTVQFLDQGSATTAAAPAVRTLEDGRTGSSFEYSIPPNGSYRIVTLNSPGSVAVGSVRAIPDNGHRAPSGLVIFSFTSDGKTVLEAGVPALPAGSAFRVYVESSGTPEQIGSIRTGLAITNAADTANTVTLEVTGLDGTLAAPPATLPLPPSGQEARFIDEFFDSLPPNFSGVLRVTSTAEVAIVGLRLRYNRRGELKMTTIPPSIETDPPTTADRFFAHIVDSRGWSMQFILFSGTAGQASSGTLSFIDTAGEPWDLPTATVQAADTSPSFSTATVSNRTYTAGTAISALTLPAASGGDGTLTYSLSPAVAGLTFNATTRQLTGTPSTAGTYAMTYTVTDEDRDTATLRFTITVATTQMTTVDLVVASVTASDDTLEFGQSFDLRATVRNAGTGASTATTLRYYRSTDATITTGDTEVGTDAVGALAAAGASDESISLTAPSTAGTYYFGACVDPVSGESDTGNNCSGAVRVTASQASDEDVYVRHESLTIGPGWVRYFGFVSGSCTDLTGSTVIGSTDLDKGVRYILISSKWQTRANSSDAWADIPGTSESSGRLCVHDPVDPGEYRLVAEISIDGQVGKYSSNLLGDRFCLASADRDASGITYANGKLYVEGRKGFFTRKVYAHEPSGQRDPDSDFDLDSANIEGITYANDRFYAVDLYEQKVYAYHASGQRDSASDFNLDSANSRASGITYANDRFFVVDWGVDKVYAYTASGQRDSASDFNLDSANSRASGITYANDRFFVVDWGVDKVYAYTASGQRDSASDFALDSANSRASGITYANDRFFVVDDADTVFVYKR